MRHLTEGGKLKVVMGPGLQCELEALDFWQP